MFGTELPLHSPTEGVSCDSCSSTLLPLTCLRFTYAMLHSLKRLVEARHLYVFLEKSIYDEAKKERKSALGGRPSADVSLFTSGAM